MNPLYELFKDEIEWPEDFTDYVWLESNGEVRWSKSDIPDDLLEENGDTYSCEIYYSGVIKSNYIMYTLYDGCGGQFQAIFSLNKKIE